MENLFNFGNAVIGVSNSCIIDINVVAPKTVFYNYFLSAQCVWLRYRWLKCDCCTSSKRKRYDCCCACFDIAFVFYRNYFIDVYAVEDTDIIIAKGLFVMNIEKLYPECKDYIWGGEKLKTKYGK